MITDPRVFEDDHLPRELMHREGEVEMLSRAFGRARHSIPADDVLISGPSGVGKTVLARHTLEKIDQYDPVPHVHIRCLGETPGGILRTALRGYPGAVDVATNTPLDELQEQLRETINDPFILILDEADGMPTSDALAGVSDLQYASIVAVCHDADRWLAQAPDDVRQSIDVQLALDRYSVAELTDILRARANGGLVRGAVDDRQLERIADEVAGVARYGIQALRAAAEIASERGHRSIADEDVADSFDRARRAIREANLRSLPIHHHVLYSILQDAGRLEAGELHHRYDEIAETAYYGHEYMPISRRARRNKLVKLQEYDLIGAEGEPQNRVYYVLDESLESALEITGIRN